MHKRLLIGLAGFLVASLLVPEICAQTVVKHMRLGNQVESIAYIPSGPYAHHVVIADGNNLIAFPAEGRGAAPWRTLFDFSACPYGIEPRGVGWIDSEHLFVFTDPWVAPTTTFCLTDHRGRLRRNVVFSWPQDMVDSSAYVEGITWVPLNAPRYAGDLIFIASGCSPTSCPSTTLFVITPAGELVARIEVNPDLGLTAYSIAYRAPGRLVLGGPSTLWESDLDGNVTAGPYLNDRLGSLEGVAVLGSGLVATAAHSTGKLIFVNPRLTQIVGERSFKIGFGLGAVNGIAWNSNTNEFLAFGADYYPFDGMPQIAAITANFSSAHRYTDMLLYWNSVWARMDFLPDENRVAMPRRSPNPREIDFFDRTGLVDQIIYGNDPLHRMRAFAYVQPTREFAIGRISFPTVLEILNRDGTTSRSFDLAAHIPSGGMIFDIAHYVPARGPAQGEFLVLVTGPQLLRLDFGGNVLAQYDAAFLSPNIMSVKAISTGRYEGAFMALDNNNNELFIFRLP